MRFRHVIGGLVAAAAVWLSPGTALSQADYPNRPITLLVPFAAGGPTDVISRIVAEHMSRTLGQQFVIENVVGAGGTTGSSRAARAAPDGYAIMMGHMGTHGASVGLYPKLAYDPRTDFEPIGLAAGTPIIVLARKDFPAKDLQEMVAHIKANAAKMNMAHAGVGSVSFTTCLLFNSLLGVKPALIPFTGTGPAMNALVAGQVDYMCDQIVNAVPQIQGGTIKAYAIATAERSPVLPDLATTAQAGLAEYKVSAWNALFAPKNTPQPVLEKLNAALAKALSDEDVRKRLLDLGSDIPDDAGRTRQALADLVKSEVDRWTPIMKASGAEGR